MGLLIFSHIFFIIFLHFLSPILAVGLYQFLLLLPGVGTIEAMPLVSHSSLGSQPFPGLPEGI